MSELNIYITQPFAISCLFLKDSHKDVSNVLTFDISVMILQSLESSLPIFVAPILAIIFKGEKVKI